ncbi:Serine/Threonine-Protein Kinase Mrck Alpha, partial [Manis pentadactyla]
TPQPTPILGRVSPPPLCTPPSHPPDCGAAMLDSPPRQVLTPALGLAGVCTVTLSGSVCG